MLPIELALVVPTDEEARFITSGRGGLPVNPRQVLQGEVILQDLRTSNSTISTLSSPSPPSQIKEATRWIVNQDGDIEFVADNRTTKQNISNKDNCQK